MTSGEYPATHTALRQIPGGDLTLENRIRYMRRCLQTCPMIDTLDQRIERQRELVEEILNRRGIDFEAFERTPPKEVDAWADAELRLLWHLLRDADYIDSLR